MTLRIEQGKGSKDRYAMLSPILLERLRAWRHFAHAQGKMRHGGWLFPGLNPIDPLSTRQLNRAIHAAAEAAEIDKRVSMHTLRHGFATHLLEQKVAIRLSRCCSVTGNWSLWRCMPRWPPMSCGRSSVRSRPCSPSSEPPWDGLHWRWRISSAATGPLGETLSMTI